MPSHAIYRRFLKEEVLQSQKTMNRKFEIMIDSRRGNSPVLINYELLQDWQHQVATV